MKDLSKSLKDSGYSQSSVSSSGGVGLSSSNQDVTGDPNMSPFSGSESNASPNRNQKSPSSSEKQTSQQQKEARSEVEPIESMSFNNPFTGTTKEFRQDYFEAYNRTSKEIEETAMRSVLQTYFGYIPLTTAKKCLAVYWSWIHPIHLTIHRSSFIHDLAIYSPKNSYKQNSCFSLALLSGIFADTLPLLYGKESELAKIVDQQAHALFMQEILFPATLATVTVALHRAISAMKHNNTTQCWIFSGISYRLAEDINLYISPDYVDHSISIENVEARSRLAWALFHWDQNISLYLSRLPIINHIPFQVEDYITDNTNDNELWEPIIEVKGNKLLSIEIMRIACLDNHAVGKGGFSLKRNASGSFKMESLVTKGKIPPGELADSSSFSDQFLYSNATASMKLKFSLLAVVNEAITNLFGIKAIPLTSASLDILIPTSSFITPSQTEKIKESIANITSLWYQAPNHLKNNHAFPLPIGVIINPTNVANSLQYHTSCILLYNYLLYSGQAGIEQPKDSKREASGECDSTSNSSRVTVSSSIETGLDSVESVIRTLCIYINYFGDFHTNYWHEHAPFISARYILSLVHHNKILETQHRSRVVSYLRALLKLLQKPIFQIPNSTEIITNIKNTLTYAEQQAVTDLLPASITPNTQSQQVQQYQQQHFTFPQQPKTLQDIYPSQYTRHQVPPQGNISSDINLHPFMIAQQQQQNHHQMDAYPQPMQQLAQIHTHIPSIPVNQPQTSPQHQFPIIPTTVYQNSAITPTMAFTRHTPQHSHNLSASAIRMLTLDPTTPDSSTTAYNPNHQISHGAPSNVFHFKPPLISESHGQPTVGMGMPLSVSQFATHDSGMSTAQGPGAVQVHSDPSSTTTHHPPQTPNILQSPRNMTAQEGHAVGPPKFSGTYELSSSGSPIRPPKFQSNQQQLASITSTHQHQDTGSRQLPSLQQLQPRFDPQMMPSNPSYQYGDVGIHGVGNVNPFLEQFDTSRGEGDRSGQDKHGQNKDQVGLGLKDSHKDDRADETEISMFTTKISTSDPAPNITQNTVTTDRRFQTRLSEDIQEQILWQSSEPGNDSTASDSGQGDVGMRNDI